MVPTIVQDGLKSSSHGPDSTDHNTPIRTHTKKVLLPQTSKIYKDLPYKSRQRRRKERKRKFTLARLDDRFGGASEASEEEGKGMEELAGESS